MREFVQLCVDYSMLRSECTSLCSVLERTILLAKLLSETERIDTRCCLFVNPPSQQASRQLVLDDLEALHTAERNHLRLSFVHKAKAELLEWRSEPAKQILYLKSLKKLALHSLQEQFKQQTQPLSGNQTTCNNLQTEVSQTRFKI